MKILAGEDTWYSPEELELTLQEMHETGFLRKVDEAGIDTEENIGYSVGFRNRVAEIVVPSTAIQIPNFPKT